jgi:crotonobetainyl-CoA:carnitine CoA-transferase CaiB-like acyl-CoA transferase
MAASPLSGVRVIELSHIMAGPVCGLMLADMGADVAKVERLPGGDGSRGFMPPTVQGESAAFMMLNRGKRGVALDLRRPEGVEAVRRLLSQADVVIENFRAGTMERIGLGWETLSEENPGLVYCQITAFGRTGPMADQGGFDLIAQRYSGLMSITGEGPGRAPVKVGAPITDITAGILAAFGVAAALFQRSRTGKGCLVDTSLLEAGITQTFWQSAIALASGASPGPLGSAHPLSAPYQAFRTADGWINVGASNQGTWLALTRALGNPSLAQDARFAENAGRMAHLADLVDALEPYFTRRSSEEWLVRLAAEGVPAGPIASVGEMLEHPQTLARDMVVEVEHSRAGVVRALGLPVKFHQVDDSSEAETDISTQGGPDGRRPARSGQPESDAPGRGAPLLGEHTREVLEGYGFEPSDVEILLADRVALSPT